ncbi:MAG: amidase [Betaproteobacteria bacterium]|nr:amidase [Betaproteobacteria bacterium]
MSGKLNELPAREAAVKLARREIGCEALARACLERIAAREPGVKAWTHIDPDQVIAQAKALDAGPVRGILHGLPAGVKDVIDTCDMPTAYGSPIYEGHRPAADAACVGMARAAGALIMGKTVSTEFATSHPGKTANPHNPRHTPGGSSSGSAAAVADRMLPLALGTQTGGSTIRPASFCGVVGFKPSFGLVNRAGVKPVAESLDTIGLFARSVADVALLFAGVTGCPEVAEIAEVPAPRVGIWRGAKWPEALPETVSAVEDAAARVARAGARVSEVEVPGEFAELAKAHHEIEYFEMARGFAYEFEHHREKLSEKFRSRIEHGRHCTLATYCESLALADQCRKRLAALFSDYDVLLTASAPGEAPEGLANTGNSVFNRNWTLLQVPCINLPGFAGPRGLPVGVQLVGRFREDPRLLACAEWAFRKLP